MSFLGGDCHISHFRCRRHLKTASHEFAQRIPGHNICSKDTWESRISYFSFPSPFSCSPWMDDLYCNDDNDNDTDDDDNDNKHD